MRWDEQQEKVLEEMRCTEEFLGNKQKWWESTPGSRPSLGDKLSEKVVSGIQAYAWSQVKVYEGLRS